MMRPTILAAALLAGLDSHAQDRQTEHQQAVSAIRKLGGDVSVDSGKLDAPVAVVLIGSDDPDQCLPHLKHIRNLRTCDL